MNQDDRQCYEECRNCNKNEIVLFEWGWADDSRVWFYYNCSNCNNGAFTDYFDYDKTKLEN